MNNKRNVGILFGGQSGEHQASLQSTKSIYDAINKDKYNVTLIGTDKTVQWLETAKTIDVFFNVIHGTTGEDGALQGMFEVLDVAYVGAGVLSSAVSMDKDVMKRLLRDAGLPVGQFVPLKKHNYKDADLKQIIDMLGFPLFVKPANSVSSVGINKAHNEKELTSYIEEAFQYDSKIVIEEFTKGREIECAILGNDNPQASVCGEVKYIDENGAELTIPATLSELQMNHIKNLAIQTYQVLECKGLALVDSFLTEEGEVYINGINTLPGFTKVSTYPKLWEASGVPYSELIDNLITLAIKEKENKNSLKRTYN
ncbi:MAG: D-alanine--D-alanine ligase [bacterium]|nr:D-alanine--D-alanine ligase [bacterium]